MHEATQREPCRHNEGTQTLAASSDPTFPARGMAFALLATAPPDSLVGIASGGTMDLAIQTFLVVAFVVCLYVVWQTVSDARNDGGGE